MLDLSFPLAQGVEGERGGEGKDRHATNLENRRGRVGRPAWVGFVLRHSGAAQASYSSNAGSLNLHGMCQAAAGGHGDGVLDLRIACAAGLHCC